MLKIEKASILGVSYGVFIFVFIIKVGGGWEWVIQITVISSSSSTSRYSDNVGLVNARPGY